MTIQAIESSKRYCKIDGCGKPALTKDACSMHYWRLRTHGTYDTPMSSRPIKERFFAKVSVGSTNDCWEWLGQKSADGYGRFRFKGGQLAHRFSFLIHNGYLPPNRDENGTLVVIMHSCNNPSCVNPDHLSEGTHAQNIRDAVADGLVKPAGKGGKRKITPETAIAIYKAEGKYKEIAERFDCTHGIVTGIKCGRRWKNVINGCAA